MKRLPCMYPSISLPAAISHYPPKAVQFTSAMFNSGLCGVVFLTVLTLAAAALITSLPLFLVSAALSYRNERRMTLLQLCVATFKKETCSATLFFDKLY